MIDQPCLYRVFLIRFGNSVGSAFAIDVDGKQYLVTAKHVVPRINDGDEIEIFFKERFNRAPIRVVECEPKDVDAIVFALPMQIASGDCPEPNAANLILSQDIYFLGFPFGWRPKTKLPDNPDFPIPYVKKGIVSSLVGCKFTFLSFSSLSVFSCSAMDKVSSGFVRPPPLLISDCFLVCSIG